MMEELNGICIDGWIVDEKVKQDPQLSIFKGELFFKFVKRLVHKETDPEEKYLLALEQDLSSDLEKLESDNTNQLLPINLVCQPLYNYYYNHCVLYVLL